jgi:hypothetical protein
LSAHPEPNIEVPIVALDAEARKPFGIGIVLLLLVSLLFWGGLALIWFRTLAHH